MSRGTEVHHCNQDLYQHKDRRRCSICCLANVGEEELYFEIYFQKLFDRDMLRCPPMLALMCCDFANSWGLYVLVSLGPTFFSEVLDFDIQTVGGTCLQSQWTKIFSDWFSLQFTISWTLSGSSSVRDSVQCSQEQEHCWGSHSSEDKRSNQFCWSSCRWQEESVINMYL